MKRLILAAVAVTALAACSNQTDDVVEAAPGVEPVPVSETRADTATTGAALAFGMTKDQLEDADLIMADGRDLADVESIVVDTAGTVTGLVLELEGAGDRKVTIPIADVQSIRRGDDIDLTTAMTPEQLAALPAWTSNVGG